MNELDQIKKILPITNAEISPTFCLAKWHHTTIYLATGETHSCYHPAPHPIPLEELPYVSIITITRDREKFFPLLHLLQFC